MESVGGMRPLAGFMLPVAGFILALVSFALPAGGAQRSRSFQVGAVVARSARVRVDAAAVRLNNGSAAAVVVDAAPPRLAAEEILLSPGTLRVTVQY
jgi:hypothetical protein